VASNKITAKIHEESLAEVQAIMAEAQKKLMPVLPRLMPLRELRLKKSRFRPKLMLKKQAVVRF
jgi:hypothetical protein